MKTSSFAASLRRSRNPAPQEHVDLHMHSRFSDGSFHVRELLRMAHERGLAAVAITDHDNIDAYEEGRELAEELGIEFIAGVEISSHHEGSDIHVLGYLFDPTHLRLNQTLQGLQIKRRTRARLIVERLNALGIDIRFEQLAAKASEGSLGRAHIAQLLVEEEYVSCFSEAFRKYLSNQALEDLELDCVKLQPEEAIRLITDAGGVAVLAHPFKTNRDDLLEHLVDAGLKGIETYCLGLSSSSCQRYRDLARRYNLVCSGGADFHTLRPDGQCTLGTLKVPYKALAMLKDLKAALS